MNIVLQGFNENKLALQGYGPSSGGSQFGFKGSGQFEPQGSTGPGHGAFLFQGVGSASWAGNHISGAEFSFLGHGSVPWHGAATLPGQAIWSPHGRGAFSPTGIAQTKGAYHFLGVGKTAWVGNRIHPVARIIDYRFYERLKPRTWTAPAGRVMFIGPKDPSELVVATIDFTEEMNPGESITSIVSYVATTIRGTDPNPSAILYGAASVLGFAILQPINAGVNGAAYQLKTGINTSQGRTLFGATILPVEIF